MLCPMLVLVFTRIKMPTIDESILATYIYRDFRIQYFSLEDHLALPLSLIKWQGAISWITVLLYMAAIEAAPLEFSRYISMHRSQ